MPTNYRLGPYIKATLRAENMLVMLEHGFVPRSDEKFIDALFGKYDELTGAQKIRFKTWIEANGTKNEKTRASKLV